MIKDHKGCTLETRKCRKGEWPLGNNRLPSMPPCCVKHLKEVLFYLHDLFDEKGIKYWMDFGTLLGAVRNGRIIPHDTDGDLCLLIEDRPQIIDLADRINKDGFCYACYKPKRDNDTHIKICRTAMNHMMVDLFFWRKDKWNIMRDSQGLNEPKSFPDYFIQTLDTVLLYDKPMCAPRDYKKFLRYRFGKDWRTPQDKKVHFIDAKHAHEGIYEYAKKKGWNKKVMML
jgi:hypothetical protein